MRLNKLIIIILASMMLQTNILKASDECFEGVSRSIFKFNMGFDKAVLKPVSKAYNKLPEPIKDGTGNFTSNIATLLSIPNFVLQGNFKGAGDATGSFLINSTFGVLGFGNPAGAMGLNVQKEDVGQTLATYGVKSGCYFVLPILGPTTARDAFGLIADSYVDPFSIATWREKDFLGASGNKIDFIAVKSASAVDFRGDNMKNFDSLEKNSLDLYSSMKSIYLQSRLKKIQNSDELSEDDWGNLDN